MNNLIKPACLVIIFLMLTQPGMSRDLIGEWLADEDVRIQTDQLQPLDSVRTKPAIAIKASGGPAVIAIDGGYFLYNELSLSVSKNFDAVFSYGTGNSYAGMQDVQRWYLPGAQPATDDINRHQSFFSLNAMMRINFLKGKKHRIFGALGPGLNVYTFSEGSLVPYENILVYKLSNKETIRMSVSLQAGYEYMITDHIMLGISGYGSQFTEFMYSLLLSAGYRF